ncbi:MAG: SGNH/GDSL hydrolase family protein [Bacteroidales bacterium]|nr:SGNH/GDSL hydrolase family protein [Bacteroidales bacterium]
MKHSLRIAAIPATALVCVLAFAVFCPAREEGKGLRRVDLGAWTVSVPDTLATVPPEEPEPAGPDTSSHRILFVGDSMVEGLRYRLSQYATANGHTMQCVIWYSSSSKYWARSDTLTHFIREFDPTYIFLCIGANELFVRNIDERDAAVGEIIREIGDLPFVWIGPPNWKPDTGINEILLRRCGKTRYYPSLRLKYQRAKDGAHPVLASYNMWADTVSTWLRDSSAHPIRWDIPAKDTPKTHGVTLLSPPKD